MVHQGRNSFNSSQTQSLLRLIFRSPHFQNHWNDKMYNKNTNRKENTEEKAVTISHPHVSFSLYFFHDFLFVKLLENTIDIYIRIHAHTGSFRGRLLSLHDEEEGVWKHRSTRWLSIWHDEKQCVFSKESATLFPGTVVARTLALWELDDCSFSFLSCKVCHVKYISWIPYVEGKWFSNHGWRWIKNH